MSKKQNNKAISQLTKESMPSNWFQRHWSFVLFGFVFFLSMFIRIQHLDLPLERDEGEYAYAGQMILQGTPPYERVYNMKMPGIYGTYALVLAVFGETPEGIHLGLLINQFLILIVLFLLVKLWFDNTKTAFLALSFYSILSISPSTHGLWANSEHFVLLPVLLGLFLVSKGVKHSGNMLFFLTGGCFLGVGFLVKQHGIAFILFAMIFVLLSGMANKKSVKEFFRDSFFIGAGTLIPFFITCFLFYRMGIFQKFWFWTIQYAREYATLTSFKMGWAALKMKLPKVISWNALVWFFAFAETFLLLFRGKKLESKSIFLLLGFLFSFLATCPGLYFRPHYFIFMIPFVAILSASLLARFLESFEKSNKRWHSYALCAIAFVSLCLPVFAEFKFFFRMTSFEMMRNVFLFNPFPESLVIADYIKRHSQPSDTVAVIGSEPQIYFYSKRHSATGYMYSYPLMEKHAFAREMQKEFMREVDERNPKFMVLVNLSMSWLVRDDSHKDIEAWIKKRIHDQYKTVGILDIYPDKETDFYWKKNMDRLPKSKYWIAVLERK